MHSQTFPEILDAEAARAGDALSVSELHAALHAADADVTNVSFDALLPPSSLRDEAPFCTVRTLRRATDLLASSSSVSIRRRLHSNLRARRECSRIARFHGAPVGRYRPIDAR